MFAFNNKISSVVLFLFPAKKKFLILSASVFDLIMSLVRWSALWFGYHTFSSICPSPRLCFHQISSYNFVWMSVQHPLHRSAPAITAIFLHHIQSYSITSHCWPCEAGSHVSLCGGRNVAHVLCGCIIPIIPQLRHTAAGTDTSLFDYVFHSHMSLSPFPHPTVFVPISSFIDLHQRGAGHHIVLHINFYRYVYCPSNFVWCPPTGL